ncbi:hypothetical protein M427DRAFT_283991 [Gonapodya prolifera JEL478]|uniref:Uncharacterized protein n=1 Tax=Gonapodya prolifera (strain JEL478) TaxID=1344416 RepID=A0A139AJN9_GONPJ|nr:hypothetical protein M427DRAFT_283991 [Gonapodya prolifera JEL478]|eukprot:KXS16764.1 hypothetical protein M427DRAFT_283991 [Gonapodya prolifera JEL478]
MAIYAVPLLGSLGFTTNAITDCGVVHLKAETFHSHTRSYGVHPLLPNLQSWKPCQFMSPETAHVSRVCILPHRERVCTPENLKSERAITNATTAERGTERMISVLVKGGRKAHQPLWGNLSEHKGVNAASCRGDHSRADSVMR